MGAIRCHRVLSQGRGFCRSGVLSERCCRWGVCRRVFCRCGSIVAGVLSHWLFRNGVSSEGFCCGDFVEGFIADPKKTHDCRHPWHTARSYRVTVWE